MDAQTTHRISWTRLASAIQLLLVVLLAQLNPTIAYLSVTSSHPRLFFDQADLGNLRAKTSLGKASLAFNAVAGYASYSLKTEAPRPDDYAGSYTPHLNAVQLVVGRAENMALYWLIRKDESHASAAKLYLMSLLTWDSWQDFHDDDLSIAFVCYGFSIGYDWLYDYLTPEERTTFTEQIEKAAKWIYSESKKEEQWWTTAYAQNHLAISHAALGLAGLALLGEHPNAENWVDLASRKIGRYLDNGTPDGGWGEGLHYWQYGTYRVVLFADALRRVTGKNLYEHWWLHDAWQFPLYTLSPARGGLVNFADCNYVAYLAERIGVIMLRLASEYRNGYAQWFAEVTGALQKSGTDRTPWNFIWYDPSISATEPTSLPKSKLFPGIGWVVFRTGWNKSDTLFALRAGSWWVHNHADQSSFVLESYGERFVIDPGYGRRYSGYWTNASDPYMGSVGHNTVLVNDLGQDIENVKQEEKHPVEGGTIESFISTSGYDYLAADVSRTYAHRLKLFTRQVTFVKPHYFVVYDDLKSGRTSVFSWLLHSAGRIEIVQDGVIVMGNAASLIIKVLSPQEWDGHVLYDQKQMIDWEKEKPIQYLRVDSQASRELQFLMVMVPLQSPMNQIPFSVSTISATSVIGALVSRGDVAERHLYRLSGGEVTIDGIQFDGSNCYVSTTSEGTVRQFALHGGTILKMDQDTLVRSSRPVEIAMTFTNATAEGTLELDQESSVDLLADDRPASLLIDGNVSSEYEYDSETATLRLPFAKGLHSIKILWQSSYDAIQELLDKASKAIEKAEQEGRTQGLEEVRQKLSEAKTAFASGNYDNALLLAKQALELSGKVMSQTSRSLVTIPTTSQAGVPATQIGWLQSGWPYLALLVTFITVILVLSTFARKRPKK